jgi:hypothetical protein
MTALQRDMWDEPGPYAQRPSSILFDEWVTKAGGRVRGSLLELEMVEEKYACIRFALAATLRRCHDISLGFKAHCSRTLFICASLLSRNGAPTMGMPNHKSRMVWTSLSALRKVASRNTRGCMFSFCNFQAEGAEAAAAARAAEAAGADEDEPWHV